MIRRLGETVRQRTRARPLMTGVVIGWVSIFVTQLLVNETRWADYAVRPLVREDTTGRADIIVVPGAGVTEACTPNVHAIQRVMLAARMYRDGRGPRILFSGGRGPRMRCAVADVMATLATQLGVPADRILVETASRSTWENGLYSDRILRPLGVRRILLVTERLHMRRAEEVFAHFGYAVERAGVPVYETNPTNVSMLYWGFREYAALLYYRLRFY